MAAAAAATAAAAAAADAAAAAAAVALPVTRLLHSPVSTAEALIYRFIRCSNVVSSPFKGRDLTYEKVTSSVSSTL